LIIHYKKQRRSAMQFTPYFALLGKETKMKMRRIPILMAFVAFSLAGSCGRDQSPSPRKSAGETPSAK
jgi:hypothetical protein